MPSNSSFRSTLKSSRWDRARLRVCTEHNQRFTSVSVRLASRDHARLRIVLSVAALYGGYTLLTVSEGVWMNGPGNFQVEVMRPFLFTASSREAANIIADMACIHYGQLAAVCRRF